MKKVIMVHCWGGDPGSCWMPNTKKQLEGFGFQVVTPFFAEYFLPTQEKWVANLAQAVGNPDELTFLVGHSLGCITILRYLESLPHNQKIGGAVLVAGFTDDIGVKLLNDFFATPIDYKKIKMHCKNFVAIHSNDDPYVSLTHAKVFEKNLAARLIIKNHAGHFSDGAGKESKFRNLPEVAESIVRMMGVISSPISARMRA